MGEWHPPAGETMPTGPDSFPATGPNALARIAPRAAARLIDAVVVYVPTLLLVALVLAVSGVRPDEDFRPPTWTTLVLFAAGFVYETGLVAWRGQTVGKLALGLRVARLDDGRTPLWWQAGIRMALPGVIGSVPNAFAGIAVAGIYLSAMWNPMARGLHDKAAGTVVVTTR